jgi:hypothetical protein
VVKAFEGQFTLMDFSLHPSVSISMDVKRMGRFRVDIIKATRPAWLEEQRFSFFVLSDLITILLAEEI